MYPVTLSRSHFPAQNDDIVEETTVPAILFAAASDSADLPALREALLDGRIGRRWTYRQLADDVERLAVALATHFAPGERIAVWAPNIPEWTILEFAAALAGLTLVTVNPAYQPKELHFVLTQSRSVGLFLVREYRGNPMADIARQVCAELPQIRRIVDMEDKDALLERGAQLRGLPSIAPGDPVQIQYTSGTTGFPKGAVLHHRGLVNNSRLVLDRAEVRKGDTYLNFMPMFHTSGCAVALLGSVQKRAPIILARLFDPARMNEIIEHEKVDALMGVPTMLIGMLEALERETRDVSSLRVAISGGAMVPPELIKRFEAAYGCKFGIVYGQTETSPVVAQTRLGDAFADKTESIGQALPQTELSIRDPQTNEVVPVGRVGEICSRGYCNMIGYNDNPEATAKTIDKDGWLHTGDLGTMDARGYLKVTGRVKDMIIRGGENLFPAEIENVLLTHPAIAEVAVVGVPDPKWGEIAVAFFRATPGPLPTREELVAHCRREMAAPKTPAHFIVVESFPQTGSGKIQKFVLREKFEAGAFPHRL
jgi:fatty-acyl-CoA synthase